MQSTRYSCQILIIYEKYWNIKFHENPSSGSRVIPRGHTGRHDEANRRFVILRKRLKVQYPLHDLKSMSISKTMFKWFCLGFKSATETNYGLSTWDAMV
jgi:hypothetical protein